MRTLYPGPASARCERRSLLVLKLKRRKTSDILVDQIKQYITSHDLKPGDHLPTESDLARSFRR